MNLPEHVEKLIIDDLLADLARHEFQTRTRQRLEARGFEDLDELLTAAMIVYDDAR